MIDQQITTTEARVLMRLQLKHHAILKALMDKMGIVPDPSKNTVFESAERLVNVMQGLPETHHHPETKGGSDAD